MKFSKLISSPILDIKNQLLTKPVLIQEQDIFLLKKIFYKIYKKPQDFFILQIGDCAESFDDCTENTVFEKCKFYNQIAETLEKTLEKEVVLIGRIAGQYAKPRTDEFEEKNGLVLPSYRGDMINSHEFESKAREPDASRLLQAYDCAKESIHFIDSFNRLYQGKKIFTSHESLMLEYESALTREYTSASHNKNLFFNGSAHTVWLGDQSRQLRPEHIEYLSTIENPIGVKIGIHQSPDTLISLLKQLNPRCEEGKIYLIIRLGAENVSEFLPKFIDVVLKSNLPVLWCVDPMHGNTFKLNTGQKVRTLDDILKEYLLTSEIHKSLGSMLSGLHLEATYLPVTECVIGAREQASSFVFNDYKSKCDPRLNYDQTKIFVENI